MSTFEMTYRVTFEGKCLVKVPLSCQGHREICLRVKGYGAKKLNVACESLNFQSKKDRKIETHRWNV